MPALLALVAVVYGASLGAPLMFDDLPNLVDNALMRFDPASFDGWRSATMSGEAGPLLRPVSMFSFALNQSLEGGFDPVSVKAGNLLVHLLCAILVYHLATMLFSPSGQRSARVKSLALIAAAVWVLHPMHVSTVLYAVQRMAQLSTLFVLLGLVVYSRYRCRWMRGSPEPGEVAALLLWGGLITCLAMLSKENGVLLPWLALVLEVAVFRGRLGGKEYPLLQSLALCLLLLPLVVAAVVYLISPLALTAGFGGRDFTLQERLLTQVRVLWHYSYWYAWPDIRNMGFQHDDIALSRSWLRPYTTLVAATVWALLLGLAVLIRKRFPILLLGVCFFLVAHSLESSIFPLEIAFEHRNYLPTVGLALLTAGLMGQLWERFPQIRPRIIVAPLLSVLTVLLMARCYIWSDMSRFTRFNAINHPDSVRAQFFYADSIYSQLGKEKTTADVSDGALLFAARNQFMKVNDAAGGHATALVMLYFADQAYLSELEDRPDWLEQLSRVLLANPRLNASDYSAIESLAKCAAGGICEPDWMRVLALVDALLDNSPGNHRLLEARYQLTAEAGRNQSVETLAQLRGLAPHLPALYSYLVTEYAARGNQAEVYSAMAQWLAHDHVRKYLPLLRVVAEKEAAPSGQSNTAAATSAGERLE